MKTKPENFKPLWALQTEVLSSGKKYLCWNRNGGKNLYWTEDKQQVPPALFQTKSDALEAIKNNNKTKEKPKLNMFKRVDHSAIMAKPVKVKIQVMN